MSDPNSVRGAVTDAVGRSADAAEEIHKAIANLPLDVIGRVRNLADVADDVREVQDRAIGAAYDLVRGINREVGRLADEIVELSAPRKNREADAAQVPRPVAAPETAVAH